MKKLLALVLALVMTLGLATVGANAGNSFADKGDIDQRYLEAVDVTNAVGIFMGDENNKLNPKDQLNRGQAAKIITYLLLGNEAAEALQGVGNKFVDVPATHWAAKYIEYLASVNVIGGVGNNKFDPDGTVTTAQFGKMLLVALGFDPEIEVLGGPDWMINVSRLLVKVDLLDGNSGAALTGNVTRQEAAQYTFNTLKSPLVQYDNKGSTITTSDGTNIKFGASNYSYMTTTNNGSRYQHIAGDTTNTMGAVAGAGQQIIEFAEQYYPKLWVNAEQVDGVNKNWDDGIGELQDDFGRPANQWYNDGKEIGKYYKAETIKYNGFVTVGKIYADLKLTDDTNATYWIDGVLQRDPQHKNATIAGAATTGSYLTISKEGNTKIGGNGTDIYVYYDNGDITVCESNWYVGDVTGVYAATGTKEAYVDITSRGKEYANYTGVKGTKTMLQAANQYNDEASGTKKTTEFALNDVVLYTVSWKNSTNQTNDATGTQKSASIKDVVKATDILTGTLNSYTAVGSDGIDGERASGSITVDGKKYPFSNRLATSPSAAMINTGAKVKIVLDKNGNAIDVDDEGIQNYAVVKAAGTVSGGKYDGNKVAVNLILTDGTTTGQKTLNDDIHGKTTAGDATYANGVPMKEGDIVTFTVNSDGDYTLTLKSGAVNFANATKTELVKNGNSTLNAAFPTGNGHGQLANGKTTFIIKDSSNNYKVYAGIKNVPNVTSSGVSTANFTINSYDGATAAGDKQTDAAARIVYIDLSSKNSGTLDSGDTVFVYVDPSVNVTIDSNNGNFYEFEAWVNGEKTMLKLDEELGARLKDEFASVGGYAMYETISYSSKNIATLGSRIFPVVGSNQQKNGVVTLGGQAMSYANNVKVFYINDNNEVLTSTVNGIPDSTKTVVWYNQDTANDLSYIFWTKADIAVAATNTTKDVKTVWDNGNTIAYVDGNLAVSSKFEVPADKVLMVKGTLTVTGGSLANPNLTVNGRVEAEDIVVGTTDTTTTAASFVQVNKNGTMITTGTINIHGDGHVAVAAGGTFKASGTGTSYIRGTSLDSAGDTSISGTTNLIGQLNVSGGTMALSGVSITTGAAIKLSGGSTTLGDTSGTGNVMISVSNDASVNLGDNTNSGTITISADSTSTGSITTGSSSSDGTIAIISDGTGTITTGDNTGTGTVSVKTTNDDAKVNVGSGTTTKLADGAALTSKQLTIAIASSVVKIYEADSKTASTRVTGTYTISGDTVIIELTRTDDPALSNATGDYTVTVNAADYTVSAVTTESNKKNTVTATKNK